MTNEFIARNGLIAQNNSTVTGSLIVTQGITGSLLGTASWALNAETASYVNTSTLTSGSILFSNNNTIAQDNTNLFWDDTNNRLGIGTNTPTHTFTLRADQNGFRISSLTGTDGYNIGRNVSDGLLYFSGSQTGNGYVFTGANGERMRIHSNGFVGIGTTSPQARLDIRAQGALTTDIAFRVRNSGDTANLFDVNGIGQVQSPGFYTNSANGIGLTSPATSINLATNDNGANIIANNRPYFTFGNNNAAINRTSGTGKWFQLASFVSFAPTSGTCTMDWLSVEPTINQTGGANGLIRGLYINPTLTSAPNFRAIETTVGNVILGSTSGNVGIGTTSPAYPLEVKGIIRLAATNEGSTGVRLGAYSDGLSLRYGYLEGYRETVGVLPLALNPTGGNVTIGTTTDSGFKLDVNGTTRLFGNTSIGGGTPGARLDVRAQGTLSTDTVFRVRNFAGDDNLASINGIGDGTFKRLSVSIGLESWMPTGSLVAGNAYFTIGTFGGSGSGFQLKSSTPLNSIYTGNGQAFDDVKPFAIQTFNGGRTWLYINTSGSIGIGTTTPQARLDIRAQGALSTDIALRVRNSADTADLLSVNGIGTTTTQTILPSINQTYSIGSGTAQFSVIHSNVHQSNATCIVRSGASSNLLMQVNGGTEVARFTTSLNFLVGTTTDVASSKLTVNSTTQGFLPPRMTTMQRNTISTPAEGLIVYTTGSSNEGLNYYNSGSQIGWHKLLSDTGSQSITGSLTVTGPVQVTGQLNVNNVDIYSTIVAMSIALG